MIRITKNGGITGRMFGAQLKATVKDDEFPHISISDRQLALYKDVPFPVCLFFFSMTNDKRYYKWLVKPTVSSGRSGLSQLANEHDPRSNHKGIELRAQDFTEINDATFSHLVDDVNQWYDVRNRAE